MGARGIAVWLLALQLCGCAALGFPASEHSRRVPADWTGSYTTWWSDDRVREEGHYKEGRRDGYVKGYHPDGSVAFEGEFKDGQPVGELVQNYPGGARAIVQQVDAGQLQGERTEYWPGGGPRSQTMMVDGQRHGECRQWHENGQLALRGHFEHDVPAGEWESWDKDGHLQARTVYWTASGLPAGYLETVQDAAGRISVQTRMLLTQDDFLGRVTMWYPNGLQAGLVEYRNGLREGLDVSWDPEGRKRSEGRRAADLREGAWTTWDASGAIEARTLFEHDRAVGPAPADSTGT